MDSTQLELEVELNSNSTQSSTTSYLNIGKELKFTFVHNADANNADNNTDNNNADNNNHAKKSDW